MFHRQTNDQIKTVCRVNISTDNEIFQAYHLASEFFR